MRPLQYPLWLRVWHGLHALLFIALTVSGLSLHYAGTSLALLEFSLAVRVHDLTGILFSLAWVAFVVLNVRKKNVVFYRPPDRFARGLAEQLRWYVIGIFRHKRRPFPHSRNRKFNPLQLGSYLVVMYALCPAICVSGFILFFPELAPERVAGAGGVWPIALIHLALAWLLSLFLILHLYMVTTGKRPLSHLREIVTGVVDDERSISGPAPPTGNAHLAKEPHDAHSDT
jgi:thiosulfate reductase cytochrome b subunit